MLLQYYHNLLFPQNCQKCRAWYFNLAEPRHFFLSFLLFFKKLSFSGDVSAIKFCRNVLSKSPDGLASEDFSRSAGSRRAANRRLKSYLKILPRDDFFQFFDHGFPFGERILARDNAGKSVHFFSGDENIKLHKIIRPVANEFVIH